MFFSSSANNVQTHTGVLQKIIEIIPHIIPQIILTHKKQFIENIVTISIIQMINHMRRKLSLVRGGGCDTQNYNSHKLITRHKFGFPLKVHSPVVIKMKMILFVICLK